MCIDKLFVSLNYDKKKHIFLFLHNNKYLPLAYHLPVKDKI